MAESNLWAMGEEGRLTYDMEACYRTLLYDLDLVAYNNCVFPGEVIPFRKSLITMAQALTGVAAVDPSRTREASYNLSQIVKAIGHPLLTKKSDRFNSDTLRIVHRALAAGLYRLVSGRDLWDEVQHDCCAQILGIMDRNAASGQQLGAVDTITGSFSAYGNLQALLALRLHDIQHKTSYAACADEVLDALEERLLDPASSLFRDAYHTGALGFTREELTPTAFWSVSTCSPGPCALALCLYHYFRPDEARRGWDSFKERFGDELLAVCAKDLEGNLGTSYLTELGGASEATLAALWCAKEMGDRAFFEALQERLERELRPRHVEVKIVLDALEGEEASYHIYADLLASVHRPWRELLDERPWAEFYGCDFDRVR